jgi:hypothetical protein
MLSDQDCYSEGEADRPDLGVTYVLRFDRYPRERWGETSENNPDQRNNEQLPGRKVA